MNIPLNIDWQQILLHLLNFVILAFGLYLLLYKPVKKFMQKRTDYYQNLDLQTKEKLANAERLEADYSQKLKDAETEILQMKTKAESASEKRKSQKIQQAKTEAAKILNSAKQEAEKERKKILDGAQQEIKDMVTSATEKLLSETETADAYEQFLTAAERSVQREQS